MWRRKGGVFSGLLVNGVVWSLQTTQLNEQTDDVVAQAVWNRGPAEV